MSMKIAYWMTALASAGLLAGCSSPSGGADGVGGAAGSAASAGTGGSSSESGGAAGMTSANGGSAGTMTAAGGSAGAPTDAFELNGVIVEGQAAKDADVVVIWILDNNAYKSAQTRAVDGAFHFSLTAPPAAALTTGFGIGFVVALPPGTTLPDGPVTDDGAIGSAGQTVMSNQALIYRAPGAMNPTTSAWPNDFQQGYSCGNCVPMTGTFDGWAPGVCGTLALKAIKTADQCNWS